MAMPMSDALVLLEELPTNKDSATFLNVRVVTLCASAASLCRAAPLPM